MEISTAMLADAAYVGEGKLYVHGGGWDSITVHAFPATHPTMALVMVFQVEWDEAMEQRPFSIDLLDEDNAPMGVSVGGTVATGHPPGATRGLPLSVPRQMTFYGLRFDRPGNYRFRITTNDEELASVRFRAALVR